jgi:hypothetical protein
LRGIWSLLTFVGSHLLYLLHLIVESPHHRPCFFSARGFHVNLGVLSWFGIFSYHICWLSHHPTCYWFICEVVLYGWVDTKGICMFFDTLSMRCWDWCTSELIDASILFLEDGTACSLLDSSLGVVLNHSGGYLKGIVPRNAFLGTVRYSMLQTVSLYNRWCSDDFLNPPFFTISKNRSCTSAWQHTSSVPK